MPNTNTITIDLVSGVFHYGVSQGGALTSSQLKPHTEPNHHFVYVQGGNDSAVWSAPSDKPNEFGGITVTFPSEADCPFTLTGGTLTGGILNFPSSNGTAVVVKGAGQFPRDPTDAVEYKITVTIGGTPHTDDPEVIISDGAGGLGGHK
jgi:hypothetical protein